MISVKELEFFYKKSRQPAVKKISFDIKEGEIFGFLGPSGAGKSTTQKILIKLLASYSGSVEVFGRDLKKWNSKYYHKIGVGFELPNHYGKLSAIENLNLFGTFYHKQLATPMELLRMVGLDEDADKKTESFSKGMKMRLNFIRAILHDPDLIFLDEPTSGLDPVNARVMKDIIKNLQNRGKTIFITTHNMHDADELCDRVGFIVNGEIKLIDNPGELKIKNGSGRLKVRISDTNEKNNQIFIFPLKGIGHNKEFLELIAANQVISIHSEDATLDDIFIKTTGTVLS